VIERRYENDKKVYVKVAATFSPDGKLQPVAFWWEDQRRYTIDRIVGVCRVASLKAGGTGVRYTCMVHGHETNLFFEEDRWFIERRDTTY
jgi:hypothetical protein